jgi:hypothetical protein
MVVMCDLGFEAWRVEMIHPEKQELKKHRLCQNRSYFYRQIKDSLAKTSSDPCRLKRTP